MIILDENIIKSQRQLLSGWRISFRHIAQDLGHEGIQDEDIIPLLHKLRRPTFFTSDADFYKRQLCHARYCIVCLAVEENETATFIRRLLRHPEFDTEAKRMGVVARVSYSSVIVWRLHQEQPHELVWSNK